jgi:hypothetical protein
VLHVTYRVLIAQVQQKTAFFATQLAITLEKLDLISVQMIVEQAITNKKVIIYVHFAL